MSANNNKTCFVIFPFNRHYKLRVKNIYQPALESVGLTVEIAGDYGTDKITDDIEKKIRQSFICFADVTEDNPNIWYEVGYAYARDKKVVLVCNEDVRIFDKLPFDIKHKNVIGYSDEDENSRAKCKKEIIADAKAKMVKAEDGSVPDYDILEEPRRKIIKDVEDNIEIVKAKIAKAEEESVSDNDIPKELTAEDFDVLEMIIKSDPEIHVESLRDKKDSIIKLKRNQYITIKKISRETFYGQPEKYSVYIPTEKAIKLKKNHPDLFLPTFFGF